ncbi:peptidase M23 [Rhodobacteraceae bacterium WD3A24]|nr:peptidase M23 [Rhodobacteraceae bacterium WD3A24]
MPALSDGPTLQPGLCVARGRAAVLGVALLALAACESGGGLDWDLRQRSDGFSTREAAREAGPAGRPAPDARGVISYPGYQVAVARDDDTVADVANRVGIPPQELAEYNALEPEMTLRGGEVLALPRRVDTRPATTGTAQEGEIDITELASGAIDRADGASDGRPGQTGTSGGQEPIRHRVERGETAFSIARLYDVTPRAIADWNGLGAEMEVREGQYLLIPVSGSAQASDAAERTAEGPDSSAPGEGTAAPAPPSAARPLPEDSAPAAEPAEETPPSPEMSAERSPDPDGARFMMPVEGRIIRPYDPGTNEGIGIAASEGAPVRAAADGTVAAITRDTDEVPILVIRHEDNLLTVYANITSIQVEQGASVSRGDAIAAVRAGDPTFVHFEVRQGFESVDPLPYLQ